MPSAPLPTTEILARVVRAAARAPSVHNTQPWRFTASGDGAVVDLFADRSRQLPVLDPDGRQLHLSCGAALQHARVAARAEGLQVEVTVLPEPADPDHLARLMLGPGRPPSPQETALADAGEQRRTHRSPFDSAGVPLEVLEQLRAAVAGEGAGLRRVGSPDALVELAVLLANADDEQSRDPRYREELERWTDLPGLPESGIGADVLDPASGVGSSLSLRRFTHDHADAASAGDTSTGDAASMTEPPPAEHPDVVVLVTPGDGPPDWLQAGQALGALLLTAASQGVLAQPLGQVTDTAGYRARLATALGLSGVPQLALRLGVPVSTGPATRRRPLGQVLRPW